MRNNKASTGLKLNLKNFFLNPESLSVISVFYTLWWFHMSKQKQKKKCKKKIIDQQGIVFKEINLATTQRNKKNLPK